MPQHPKGREIMRTFRVSESEYDLLKDCMSRRGFKIETQYMRFLLRQEGDVMGDASLVQAVREDEPIQRCFYQHNAPTSWANLHGQLVAMVKSALNLGNIPPPWALTLVGHSSDIPLVEPPPAVCCRNPNPEFVGVGIVCSCCESSLPPAAAAQAALWRAKRAAATENHELKAVFERLAQRLQEWADREEFEPEIRALRLRYAQTLIRGRQSNDTTPPSNTAPKVGPVLRAARLRGGKTIMHIRRAESNYALCGVRLIDQDVEVFGHVQCANCARIHQTSAIGSAA